MSEQWYWKHGRQLLGPLDTETLEHLIRQHRVAERDQIRLTTEERWLSGAEIKALFAGRAAAVSPSEAAARLLSQAGHLHAAGEADAAPASGRYVRIRSLLRSACGPIEGIADRLSDVFAFFLKLAAPLLNRYVLLALTVAVLVGVIVGNVNTGNDARNQAAYHDLTEAWDAWKDLESRDARADDYEELSAATLPALERHLNLLMQDARTSPGRSSDSFSWLQSGEQGWNVAHARKALIQSLLAMQALLKASSADAEKSSEKASRESSAAAILQQNMLVARQYLDGEMRPPTDRYWRAPPEVANTNPGLSSFVVGVLIVDGVLIVAGVWYWRRRSS